VFYAAACALGVERSDESRLEVRMNRFCTSVLALLSICISAEKALTADESSAAAQTGRQKQVSQKFIEKLHAKFSQQVQAASQREQVRVCIMELPEDTLLLEQSDAENFDDKDLKAFLDQPEISNTLEELASAASETYWLDFTTYDVTDIDADTRAKASFLATVSHPNPVEMAAPATNSPTSIVLVLPSRSHSWLSELGKIENLSSVHLGGESISFQTIEELAKLKKIPSLTLLIETGSRKTLEALAGLGNVSSLRVGGDFGGDAAMKSVGRMQNLTSLLIVNYGSDEPPAVDKTPSPKLKPADSLGIGPDDFPEMVETTTPLKPGDLTTAEMELTQDGLLHLSQLPHLKSLQLFERTITAKELQAIAKIQNLASLQMITGKIAEHGLNDLVALKDLTKLELCYFYLWYQDRSLTDVGVAAIGRLKNLTALSISISGVAETGFTHLANLTNLSTFKLVVLKATDEQLKWISLVPTISHLSLERGAVTDASLMEVGKLTSLRLLDLSATSVTDVGMAEIGKLPRLKSLNISGTRVSDAGLKEISDLKELVEFYVSGKITDAGMPTLAKLKTLVLLDLATTYVTNAGLAKLTVLENLSSLNLCNTSVDDSGITEIAKFKKLSSVKLRLTHTTRVGIAKLQKELPHCEISK
jgi:hypothetical protein